MSSLHLQDPQQNTKFQLPDSIYFRCKSFHVCIIIWPELIIKAIDLFVLQEVYYQNFLFKYYYSYLILSEPVEIKSISEVLSF